MKFRVGPGRFLKTFRSCKNNMKFKTRVDEVNIQNRMLVSELVKISTRVVSYFYVHFLGIVNSQFLLAACPRPFPVRVQRQWTAHMRPRCGGGGTFRLVYAPFACALAVRPREVPCLSRACRGARSRRECA